MKLLYGTSSWSEPSWEGAFYPRGTLPGDFLAYYATQFSTVEADNTYYRIPSRSLVAGWEKKTPPGFILSAKFPRSIVHGGDEATPRADKILTPGPDVEAFLEAMRGLGKKCGPLVLQFPYFNKKAFASPGPFFERLDEFLGTLPKDFRYGVELRNKTWISDPLLDILKKHRTALVLVDINYMPHPADWKVDPITTDFTYIRLIGDRKAIEATTETWDKIVMDRTDQLRRWAEFIPGLDVELAYIYANNHYAGHGPATIRELKELIHL